MNLVLALALLLPCSAPPSDLMVTKEKHSDGNPAMGLPASDTTEVMWLGADRMRVEDGKEVTIVRADLKKMYKLDTAAKTYSVVDLPLDMKKYMPAEMAPMMEQMGSQVKATVTPTTETKQIQGWTATRYTMTVSLPMGGSLTQELWATKDVGGDLSGMRDMYASMMASVPFAAGMASEMKKVEGLVVLSEGTQKMMGSESKTREAVLTVEEKEAPADTYELPKGYTEKPFDPTEGMMGGPGHGKRGAPRGGG